METVGIVDLGSNSVRLAVVRIQADGGYRLLAEAKAVLRLAAELGSDGAISDVGLQRTLAALRDFLRMGRVHGVSRYLAVATAAVRQAANGPAFIAALTDGTGMPFQIISGQEESELSCAGALNTLAETNGLLVDIGGGSTELVRFAGRRVTAATSLPYGAVNLMTRFLPGGTGNTDGLERFLADLLTTVPWLHSVRGLPLIGVGGTVRSLAKIDQKACSYPLGLLHNYRMAPDRVRSAYHQLRSKSLKERRKVPGLSDDRVDIIVPALAMLWQVLERSGAGELAVSGTGVREGLLHRYLLKEPVLDDVLGHSVANLVHIYGLDERSSRETARLTLALYDGLQPLHRLDDRARRCLGAAAALDQAGRAVNVYGQDQHTFYLLTRGRLHGLSHREIILTGAIAGFEGHGKAQALLAPFRDLLGAEDEGIVRRLGVLTAMARELTRYEPGAVQDLTVAVSPSAVQVRVRSGVRMESEVASIEGLAGDFRKAWGRDLSVEAE